MDTITDKEFLLKEVFTKVEYNRLLEKYIIPISAYIPLGLTVNQFRLLEKMCKENDIELEKLPPKIKHSDAEQLLVEYNQIKNKIVNNPQNSENENLRKKQIEIRNKVAEGYMSLMYKMITKKILYLEEQDKEDIYQIGYTVLLRFIDQYNPSKGLSFDIYIRTYGIHRIIDELIKTNKGFKLQIGRDLRTIKNLKKQLPDENISTEKISNITGFTKEKIDFLETLEKVTQDISLQEILETEPISENDLEEYIIDKTIKENLIKLLELLSEEEREVIKLYYGFYDDIEYSLEKIAEIKGYNNRERVRQIKDRAINKLKLPIYNIYISLEYSENSTLENYLKTKKTLFEKNALKEYEISLLTSLPNDVLEELIKDLPEETKIVLSLYLGLNGNRYNMTQIGKMLNISKKKTNELINSGLHSIKIQMSNQRGKGYRQGEYYKYLTQSYLNRSTKR